MNDPVKGDRPELPIDFIHIPKAAGHTFQNYIRRAYRPRPFAWFHGNAAENDVFRALPEAQRHAIDFVIGHHHWGIGRLLRQPVTTIVILRDPVERVVSHYYHVVRDARHTEHARVAGGGLSLHEYVEARSSRMIDNDHVRWLNEPLHSEIPFGKVDRDMLDRATERLSDDRTIVGLVERFDEFVAHVSDRLAWPDVGADRANENPDRPRHDEIPSATRTMIAEMNALDVELYDHARRLFEHRLATADATP